MKTMSETMGKTESMRLTDEIRADFPLLNEMVHGKSLTYLDNAATAQKPSDVIDAIVDFYRRANSNVHRGVHHLSQVATEMYEEARNTTRDFIHASSSNEVIFTRGTTDSINLLAHSIGKGMVSEGDEILTTELEHHSNFVPWQEMARERKAIFKTVPIEENGDLDTEKVISMLSERTKVLAISHASNTLGTLIDIEKVSRAAHEMGTLVAVDGAQFIPHHRVDVQKLDCDFYSFSAHKLFGPTGIGVLYGKKALLEKLPPYQTGGGMISEVGLQETSYIGPPQVFEAGTPNMAGAVGMSRAMKYISGLGFDTMEKMESHLLGLAHERLSDISGLRMIGTSSRKVPVISFVIDGLHPFDIGSILDQMGIAVRTGHHCTQPIMKHFGIAGTVRASFAFYNTEEEVEKLREGLLKAIKLLS